MALACLCNKASARAQVQLIRVRCFLLEQSKFTKPASPSYMTLTCLIDYQQYLKTAELERFTGYFFRTGTPSPRV
jgi:hypothetical protein